MNKTKIEYLDFTWNPIAMRCTPISDGCENCWHLAMANRLKNINPGMTSEERRAYGGGPPFLRPQEVNAPSRRKKRSRIGVQFMGDLFHENIKTSVEDTILQVIYGAYWHTFLILTKRPKNMKDCFDTYNESFLSFKNLWLGVTAENQKRAGERIPILLQIPAAVRFVSLEPLLEPISLKKWLWPQEEEDAGVTTIGDINWLILGCESGPKRRPCKIEWMENIIDQADAARVPVFVKQISLKGKVIHDINQFPKKVQRREFPNASN